MGRGIWVNASGEVVSSLVAWDSREPSDKGLGWGRGMRLHYYMNWDIIATWSFIHSPSNSWDWDWIAEFSWALPSKYNIVAPSFKSKLWIPQLLQISQSIPYYISSFSLWRGKIRFCGLSHLEKTGSDRSKPQQNIRISLGRWRQA